MRVAWRPQRLVLEALGRWAVWHPPPHWLCHLSPSQVLPDEGALLTPTLWAAFPLLFLLGFLFSSCGFPVVSFGPGVVVRA